MQGNEETTEEEAQRREMQQFQNVVYGNHSSILLHAYNSGSKRAQLGVSTVEEKVQGAQLEAGTVEEKVQGAGS